MFFRVILFSGLAAPWLFCAPQISRAQQADDPPQIQQSVKQVLETIRLGSEAIGAGVVEQIRNATPVIIDGVKVTQNWTTDQIGKLLEKFSVYQPILKRAGFDVTQFTIVVGVWSGLEVDLTESRRIPQSIRDKILEKHSDDVLLSSLLKSLYEVSKIQIKDYHSTTTQLFISYAPHTRVTFVPDSS